jgi:hypothetical protein
MKLLKRLFSSLNKESIRYMIAGGIAVNLYGIERATADIDIILMLEKTNLLKFVKVAKKLGLKPKLPVKIEDIVDEKKRMKWITEKKMKVFSLYDTKNSFFLLDIFVDVPFDFDEVYKRRKKVRFENTIVSVVPIEELINMKKKSNRPQDKADIFYLEKILKGWKDE